MAGLNSLDTGRCGSNNYKSLIFEHVLRIKFISPLCEIELQLMPQNDFDDHLRLVQVLA